MSADTMPCGCEGHFDNEDLCDYPRLKVENERLNAELSTCHEANDDLVNWHITSRHELADARYALSLHIDPATKHVHTCGNRGGDEGDCSGACMWTRKVLAVRK